MTFIEYLTSPHGSDLLKSALWITFYGIVIWVFSERINLILDSLRARIDAGGAIKAGPIEISQLNPAGEREIIDKAESEIKELENSEETTGTIVRQPASPVNKDALREYIEFENKAISKLERETGKKFLRNVEAFDNGMLYDGVNISNGRINIVEVKRLRTSLSFRSLTIALQKFVSSIATANSMPINIYLVIIVDEEMSEAAENAIRRGITDNVSINLIFMPEVYVAFYTKKELIDFQN